MKAMRFAVTLIFAMVVVACLAFSVSAEGEALAIKTTPNLARLTDGAAEVSCSAFAKAVVERM